MAKTRPWLVFLLLVGALLSCARSTTPISEWAEFEGQGVTLWLPHNYGEMTPRDNAATDSDPKPAQTIIFEASESYLLYDDAALAAYVFAARGSIPLFKSLKAYAEDRFATLPQGSQLVEQGEIDLGGRTAWRIIIEQSELATTTAIYLVRRGVAVYSIAYAGSTGVFEELLADSEQSMCTFRVTS